MINISQELAADLDVDVLKQKKKKSIKISGSIEYRRRYERKC